MIVSPFNFQIPTKIIFGNGTLKQLGAFASKYGEKVMLVTGKYSLVQSGYQERIFKYLYDKKIKVTHFNQVEGDPTVDNVDLLAEAVKKESSDVLIGIGGGSVIDSAKMAAVCALQGTTSWDFFKEETRPAKKILSNVLPIIAVPTTAGTATESTPFSVLTNEEKHIKKGIGSPFLYPKISIIDPELHISLPPHLTAWTGMDGFCQALEAFVSIRNNAGVKIIALQAMKLIYDNLMTAYQDGDDVETRTKIALGVCLSGTSIAHNDTNLAHAMSFSIGARYQIHHGLSVAILTPGAMEFNLPNAKKDYCLIGKQLGCYRKDLSQKENAEILIIRIKELIQNLGIPSSLKSFGIPKGTIDELVLDANDIGSLTTNKRTVNQNHLKVLYERVLA